MANKNFIEKLKGKIEIQFYLLNLLLIIFIGFLFYFVVKPGLTEHGKQILPWLTSISFFLLAIWLAIIPMIKILLKKK